MKSSGLYLDASTSVHNKPFKHYIYLDTTDLDRDGDPAWYGLTFGDLSESPSISNKPFYKSYCTKGSNRYSNSVLIEEGTIDEILKAYPEFLI